MLNQDNISRLFKWCALLAGISVALGAFGAHVFSEYLSEKGMDTFGKAGYYLLTHSIAAILLMSGKFHANIRISGLAVYCIFYGALIFSASLYTICAAELSGLAWLRKAGIIAPFGGAGMICGWLMLAIHNFKKA